LLQMNRIGAITAVTAELNRRAFQTVIWDWRAQQDPDVGWIDAGFKALELAEGFHFALTLPLYHGDFGSAWHSEAVRFPETGTPFRIDSSSGARLSPTPRNGSCLPPEPTLVTPAPARPIAAVLRKSPPRAAPECRSRPLRAVRRFLLR
jgi:hypothetical protein